MDITPIEIGKAALTGTDRARKPWVAPELTVVKLGDARAHVGYGVDGSSSNYGVGAYGS